MKIVTSIHIEKGSADLQDCAEIFRSGERTVLALADGVGGISGGTLAAETFVYNIRQGVEHLTSVDHCRRLLLQVDRVLAGDIHGAQTTGIVAVIESGKLFGAFCGDSEARIYRHDQTIYLSQGRAKPFLGSGNAQVVEFEAKMEGVLVVATDGLWKYAKSSDIGAIVRDAAPETLAVALSNLPRLRSGNLPDDIAVVTYTCL